MGDANCLDCSLGINHFGVSDGVLEAAKGYDWSRVWDYPDPTYKDLKERISEFWLGDADLEAVQIQIAHGASAVLDRLNRVFIEPGSKVLGYAPQWPYYTNLVEACGGKYEAVLLDPEAGFKFDVERLVANITDEYCLIFIDNPNNPTGQLISLEEIEQILKQAQRKDVLVVIDEAYGDYMEKGSSAVGLTTKYRNLMVVRSFSKGFGLAGLRVGYGILPLGLTEYYDKLALPFSVSAASCYLAKVALSDLDFIHGCQERIQKEKAELIAGLRGKGYLISETSESCPIFTLGYEDRGINLREELLAKGILAVAGRHFRNLGDNYVRINIPTKADEFLNRLEGGQVMRIQK